MCQGIAQRPNVLWSIQSQFVRCPSVSRRNTRVADQLCPLALLIKEIGQRKRQVFQVFFQAVTDREGDVILGDRFVQLRGNGPERVQPAFADAPGRKVRP